MRRVVIDSQASRRERMSAPPPQRPPRRRGGRRRRPLLEEPPKGPTEEVELPAVRVASGATVREVAETLGVNAADLIKTLMQLGEMATLTQTLTDETIEVLAKELGRRSRSSPRPRKLRRSRPSTTRTPSSSSVRPW